MARVEHGQYKVQAEDIAYTINGWIKGSNSTALDSTLDMGSDSDTGYLSWNTAIHKFIARDEVSYSLGYYNGDYESISTAGNNWLASLTSSGLGAASSQLFNGNIGHMATNWRTGIAAQAMAYDYDQLNRLVEATAFQNLNAGTNTWSSGGALTDYHEEYAYDLNGNILTLEREGTTDMDDFDYNYISNTNQLEYVGDAVSSGNYAVDIDNQSSGNYAYNEIGQLVDDNSENATYDWNVYGKIKEVGRTGSGSESALAFAYDPQGNRAYKAVKPRTSGTLSTQLDWTEEWYVRDVRGNIMAVYGSSYDSTGHPGAQACGYFRLLPDPLTVDGDKAEIYLDGIKLHNSVGWLTDAVTTACLVAAAINSYSSTYWATCGGDTVYVCTEDEGVTHNGEAFTAGPNHNGLIGLDTFALRGGINNTLLYHMSLDMDEHHIYGSSRLGISSHLGTITEMEFDATVTVQGNFDNVDVQSVTNNTFQNAFIAANTSITGGGTIPTKFMKEDIGLKIYEYTNHLGNVLLTTNDKRLRIDNNSDNLIDSYLADDLSKSDYYPYGMAMVGRNTNLSDYRFGYQGSEMDNEFDGSAGSHYTTYFRQLDPRLGRWMSIDPVVHAWESPYASMGENPIYTNDPVGNFNVISNSGGGFSVTNRQGQKVFGIGGKVKNEKGARGSKSNPIELREATIVGEKPTLAKMVKTRLSIALRSVDSYVESLKGPIGNKAPKMSVHSYGQQEEAGIFPQYKNDKDVSTTDFLDVMEDIGYAYKQMGYDKMNWRDQAKKYVSDSKDLKQLDKALAELRTIYDNMKNGDYYKSAEKISEWLESPSGQLVIKTIDVWTESTEAAQPAISQPTSETAQQVFDIAFERVHTKVKMRHQWGPIHEKNATDTNELKRKGWIRSGRPYVKYE